MDVLKAQKRDMSEKAKRLRREGYITGNVCGKEIHFTGKWGTKGFLAKPRVEKHGQSQVAGTFYEGDTPYEHQLSNCWVECMEAYDYKLREWGFDVVD